MWPALIPLIGGLLDKFFPNAADAANAKLKLMEMAQNGELAALSADLQLATGQLDTNKIEAANPNLFIAGWRPFIGWTCGVAFLWNFVLGSVMSHLLQAFGHNMQFIPLNMTEMMPVLLGLLGLGGYRTYEKIKNVQ